MALDFPANPTNGQVYDSYVYNSTVGAWQAREDSATVAITSPTAPATANNGDIWYNSNTGVSYVYYADGSSAQWVEIISSAVPLLNTKADLAGATFTGDVIAPSFSTNSFKRIAMPDGAEYTTQTSSVTGAIKIVLPVGMTNTMVRMTIRVFEYASNESFDLVVGGYNYSPTSTWVNTSAYILGSPGMNRQFSVRFGYDGSKSVVYVGELSSTWSYPQIYVTDVTIGYSGISLSWLDSWSISFESTAFAGVTSTLSSQQVGYQSSSSTANSLALRDSSANITSNAFISTQATGTAPFTVSSTTAVTNLNADLLDGNHASAFSLSSHTHSAIVSKGNLSAETLRATHDSGVYTFNSNNLSLGDSTPTSYWSTIGWGNGGAGTAELASNWVSSGNELWYRSLRDTTDNWWAWKKINHTGVINTAPLQPSFLATKSDNGSAYSGDYVFNIAMHNTGGYYSTSTGRFTAPVAGRYYFVAEAQTYGVGAGTLSTISFKKNGTLYMDSSGGTPKTIVNKAVDATYHNTIVLAMVIDCAANDYVTVFTENTRGMQSHFSGYLIG